MYSFWIILLSCALSAHASPTCTEDALVKCNELKVRDDLDITFPKDAEELESQCRSEQPPLFCYSDFVERCPSSVTSIVREFYIESKKLFNRICGNNGDLKAKYLRNAKCLNDIMTNQMDFCVQEHSHKEAEGACAFQTAVMHCLGSLVTDTCGGEGLDIMKEVYRVMKPMLENGICDQ